MMSPTISACILGSLVHQNGYGRAGGGGPPVSKHTTSRCAIVLQDPFTAETSMQVDVSRIANTRVGGHAHYPAPSTQLGRVTVLGLTAGELASTLR